MKIFQEFLSKMHLSRQIFRENALAFYWMVEFDDTVDASNIVARYENGLLQLIIPKNEKAKPVSRTISIQ